MADDDQIPRELMSQADYARHRGVARQTVHEYVTTDKIRLYVDPVDGKQKVDAIEADVLLGANVARVNTPAAPADEAEGEDPEKNSDATAASSLTKARTASEIYRARTLQLQYDQLVGKLREAEDVRQATQQCAEVLVREIEQLATRADDLASAFTSGGIQGLRGALKSVSAQIREKIAIEMRALADPAAAQDDQAA